MPTPWGTHEPPIYIPAKTHQDTESPSLHTGTRESHNCLLSGMQYAPPLDAMLLFLMKQKHQHLCLLPHPPPPAPCLPTLRTSHASSAYLLRGEAAFDPINGGSTETSPGQGCQQQPQLLGRAPLAPTPPLLGPPICCFGKTENPLRVLAHLLHSAHCCVCMYTARSAHACQRHSLAANNISKML